MTKVKLILSFISGGLLLLWFLNHISIYENIELKVFVNMKLMKPLVIDQMIYLEEMYTKLLNLVNNHFQQCQNELICYCSNF